MNRGLVAVLAVVTLDAMGIGLAWPIIPTLLREVGHTSDLGWRFGAFLSAYALLQFLCAPVLGLLSDRFGRRPVLLASAAGAAIDYTFMTFAPTFWLLLLGRAIAGISGASLAVAQAYLVDVTPEAQRARRFGQLGACFGLGFVAGPALGGLLGSYWTRAPFLAAAGLCLLAFGLVLLALPETRTTPASGETVSLNPFGPLRWAFRLPGLLPLIATFTAFGLIGEIAGTVWVLYGEDRFGWEPQTIGLSLALFGLLHALAQAFLVGPVVERWGQRQALLLGMASDASAYLMIALATQGWVAFLLLPLFCIGGIGGPALQSLLTARVAADHQGRLQGVLASMTSLASIFGPLATSLIYFASRGAMPGLVWLLGAGLYLLTLPLLLRALARPAPLPAEARP